MGANNHIQNRQAVPNRDQLLTLGDLEDFKEYILNEFKSLLKQHGGEPGKKWIKSAEVKKLLNISHNYLQQLRDTGALPFIRIGGAMYYEMGDIQKMMDAHKIKNERLSFGLMK